MKKYNIYIGLFLAALLITACSKDKDDTAANAWKQQNEQVFNDLSKDPDYIKLKGSSESIYYKVIKKGDGKKVSANCLVHANYKGWFVTTNESGSITAGDVFDKSANGDPFKVKIENGKSNVITGWNMALLTMAEGDKWEVWIPYGLAYGKALYGPIPGYSTLAFEMEVVKVVD